MRPLCMYLSDAHAVCRQGKRICKTSCAMARMDCTPFPNKSCQSKPLSTMHQTTNPYATALRISAPNKSNGPPFSRPGKSLTISCVSLIPPISEPPNVSRLKMSVKAAICYGSGGAPTHTYLPLVFSKARCKSCLALTVSIIPSSVPAACVS